ncbi:MAG: hypothetical protein KDB14_30675, partial [Planctomycetales bacterium]|nr:hypothetical protein [Planctomycetales bacterium]
MYFSRRSRRARLCAAVSFCFCFFGFFDFFFLLFTPLSRAVFNNQAGKSSVADALKLWDYWTLIPRLRCGFPFPC